MAELLKKELGVQANLVKVQKREFTVLVGDQVVAQKGWIRCPKDEVVLVAVKQALAA